MSPAIGRTLGTVEDPRSMGQTANLNDLLGSTVAATMSVFRDVAMRALGEPDALPSGDLGLLRALGLQSSREIERRAEGWAALAGLREHESLVGCEQT